MKVKSGWNKDRIQFFIAFVLLISVILLGKIKGVIILSWGMVLALLIAPILLLLFFYVIIRMVIY